MRTRLQTTFILALVICAALLTGCGKKAVVIEEKPEPFYSPYVIDRADLLDDDQELRYHIILNSLRQRKGFALQIFIASLGEWKPRPDELPTLYRQFKVGTEYDAVILTSETGTITLLVDPKWERYLPPNMQGLFLMKAEQKGSHRSAIVSLFLDLVGYLEKTLPDVEAKSNA